jgi:hypothetical protein
MLLVSLPARLPSRCWVEHCGDGEALYLILFFRRDADVSRKTTLRQPYLFHLFFTTRLTSNARETGN